jgi:hypothetical protein
MRKTIPVAAGIFLLTLLSTSGFAQEKVKDKDKPRIEGSGNLVTKDIPVQSFDALSANGVFSVVLTQGNKEQVKIEADDNLQPLFEVTNEGSTLKITMKKDVNINSKDKMRIYITFKNLKSMDLKMVGNLSSEGSLNFNNLSLESKSVGSVDLKLAAQKLDINNKSVGSLKLSGKADNAIIKNNGVGSLKASDLLVQTMDIENEGVGSAEVNAAKELKVKDSFLGKVKNVGSAPIKRMNKVVI